MVCKEMLETILNVDIERIEYPELQKTIDIAKDARSVRLDVYVKDNKETIYNVEIQASNTGELPKRSHYYQGMIDLNRIEKGADYELLNKSYIIFICTFDLFKKGRHIYIFENTCKEKVDVRLGDDSTKIFLNSDSTMDDVSGNLKAFLDYVGGKKSKNELVEKLEKEVMKAKGNREWRREYMTLLMRDRENIKKGMEQGKAQGKTQERQKIILKMLKQGFNIEQIMSVCEVSEEEIKHCND